MKTPLLLLLPAIACVGRAVEDGDLGALLDITPPVAKRPGFHLDLVPKAFQSDPQIEMTVYGERTEYGRTLPDVSVEEPVYYVAQSKGYQPMGSNPIVEHPPAQEKIDKLLQRVLELRGFLPARERTHPPTLAILYYWGSHSGLTVSDLVEHPEMRYLRDRDILQRTQLVGGRAAVEKRAWQMGYGVLPGVYMAKEAHLLNQAEENLYYVVVSAYDFNTLALGERRLVWRTTMTVNDVGVSMKETLPPLIVSALAYLGRDTGEPVALERRIQRGSVTLGPLMIIGEASPPASASSVQK